MTADNRPEALERVYAEAFNASQDADETTDAHDARIAGLLAVYRAGQNKWVSVAERLPEDGIMVLGYWTGNVFSSHQKVVRWDARCQFWRASESEISMWPPTHWQPLPEPPQSVTETQGE